MKTIAFCYDGKSYLASAYVNGLAPKLYIGVQPIEHWPREMQEAARSALRRKGIIK